MECGRPGGRNKTSRRVRFEIPSTEKLTFINGSFPKISPNGRWVVFPAIGPDKILRMWIRALDSVELRPLAGTESGNNLPPPVFWSPDSRYIAFGATPGPFAPGQLKKLDISGGPPQTICDTPSAVVGGTWNRDGVIVFSHNATGRSALMRVSAAGGVATAITAPDPARGERFTLYPEFLPDGRHFLYFRLFRSSSDTGAYVDSADAKPEEQSSKPFFLTDRQVSFANAVGGGPGYLLFLRESTLFAQPFDPGKLVLSGEPVPVADQVGSFAPGSAGLYSVSNSGVLAYRTGSGGSLRQLTWVDRDGKVLGTVGDKSSYSITATPAISPDETRVAVTQFDGQRGSSNIWVLDTKRGTSTRLTFGSGNDGSPVWSPDGKKIAFASNRGGHQDLYEKPADGSGEEQLLLKSEEDKQPTGFSRDGRLLLYTVNGPKTGGGDIFMLLDGERKPMPVLQTEFFEGYAQFSPDGRWIAYTSGESGTPEIYVRPFSPQNGAEGAKWLVSKGGGNNPHWRADGKELLYLTPDGQQQMAVDVTTTEKSVQPGTPHKLFTTDGSAFVPNPTLEGKRFLYAAPEGANAQTPFMIVLNWQAGLKK